MEKHELSISHVLQTSRHDFAAGTLLEQDCKDDPFKQFETWFNAAIEKDSAYANAMTLCTTNDDGMPDCRIVLLRDISYSGFTFFSNYHSAKGKQIEHNSKACLLFFWKDLQRQVKIQGEIRFLPPGESDKYFNSRPFESQVGTWASQQSTVVSNRKVLDDLFEKALKKYEHSIVPRPEYWGGYVLLPLSFEFWQGRTSRLHDRIRYTHLQDKTWKIERLMP